MLYQLSYVRAAESATNSGPPAVTVCTHDVTFRYFQKHGRPVLVDETRRNSEVLIAAMVEFEDDGIALTTVDARVCFEELQQPRCSDASDFLVERPGVFGVAPLICLVMALLVMRPAGPTVRVTLALGLTSPHEIVERLGLSAHRATLHPPSAMMRRRKRPRRAVALRWQLAHRTSHLAISATIAAQDLLVSSLPMRNFLSRM